MGDEDSDKMLKRPPSNIRYGKGHYDAIREQVKPKIEGSYLPKAREIGFPLVALYMPGKRDSRVIPRKTANDENDLRAYLEDSFMSDIHASFAFEKPEE